MTILLVDDELTYRLLVKSLLIEDGHEVVLAEDGAEALEKLQKHQIDLIISDIYMPVMDGFKLHKAVRTSETHARLPILFVSAFGDQLTLEVVRDPKIDAFLRKGSPYDELREWLHYLTAPDDLRPSRLPGTRSGSRSRRE